MHSLRNTFSLLLLLIIPSLYNAQEPQNIPQDQHPKVDEPYDKEEEMIYDQKRYRVHNNYLTFGGGYVGSSLRNQAQKQAGADFTFHVRYTHFQLGVMMSGVEYLSNNDIQFHFGYGKRIENRQYNFSLFGGGVYGTGVLTETDTLGRIYPVYYDGFGGYLTLQGIVKLTYDIGIGAELTARLTENQRMMGFRLVLFFSGAYRGPKKNFNPHVHSENPR